MILLMGKKSTNKELEERIQDVADYLLRFPLASCFDLHKEFCPKFGIEWRQCDRYEARARALNKRRLNFNRDEMAEIGKAILLDCLKSPLPKVRIAAEARLAEIVGYNAPRQTELGGLQDKPLQFVPLSVDPKDVVGCK